MDTTKSQILQIKWVDNLLEENYLDLGSSCNFHKTLMDFQKDNLKNSTQLRICQLEKMKNNKIEEVFRRKNSLICLVGKLEIISQWLSLNQSPF